MARERYGNWWYKQEENDGLYHVYRKDGNQPVFTNSNLRAVLDYMIDQHIHELERENAELKRRDVLTAIVTSTQNLYARFGITPTRVNTLAKVKDETKEFIDELKRTHIDAEDLADEFGDYQVVGTMAAHIHLPLEKMIAAIWRVIAKNDAKTTETHVVIDGIITRKDKVKQVS